MDEQINQTKTNAPQIFHDTSFCVLFFVLINSYLHSTASSQFNENQKKI